MKLPCGNRIISHASVCKVLKQLSTVVERVSLISDNHIRFIKLKCFLIWNYGMFYTGLSSPMDSASE